MMMDYLALSTIIFIWIARFIAAFCLVSIAVWGAGMYLWARDWQVRVRDAGIFLLVIGVLTIILALKPAKMDAYFWPPLVWFSFAMLIVMELLWITFLVEFIIRLLKAMATHDDEPPHRPPIYTRYPEA